MENLKEKLAALISKQQWSGKDYEWLLDYLDKTEDDELQRLMYSDFLAELGQGTVIEEPSLDNILDNLHHKIDKDRHRIKLFKNWMAIAASIVGVLVLTYIFFNRIEKKSKYSPTVCMRKNHHTKLTKAGVVLTLSNGAVIPLSHLTDGNIARDGKTTIVKKEDKLVFHGQQADLATSSPDNLLTTAQGAQYQLQLSDGTKVWLNAASSLRFPSVFKGRERLVQLTGEAYFEVSKNPEMPFIVQTGASKIKVLGTHFNVMAYSDEKTLKTTLLEGAIRFMSKKGDIDVKPGEQVELAADGAMLLNKNVDLNDVVAWKRGFFHFEHENLESIMLQLSRWYGIEVVYKSKVNALFFAEMPRNTALTDVLKALELAGKVKFEVSGRKVIVEKP
jgi:hypothetical protein